ncbi:hypothetical protein CYD30_12050, partial [Kosakonia cowanii]
RLCPIHAPQPQRNRIETSKIIRLRAEYQHINTMSGNPFLMSFATLFHSVYHTYFTSITENEVIKLDLHQAIVDAIQESDGDSAFQACQRLLNSPN